MQLQHKRGFTLVELLVVVLIIGILTTVALPQYQRAVSKARMSEALSNIATLERAEQACVLANKRVNNTNCTEMSNLDVSLADSSNWAFGLNSTRCGWAEISSGSPQVCALGPEGSSASLTESDVPWLSSYKQRSNANWTRRCHYKDANQQKICEGLRQYGYEMTGSYSWGSGTGTDGSSTGSSSYSSGS